jgi:hypothetical protein
MEKTHFGSCLAFFSTGHCGKFHCLFGLSSSPGVSPLSSSAPKIQQNLLASTGTKKY